jgi:hypothetical protein
MPSKPVKLIIQQPQLLPWAGLWFKYISADRYVVYAGVTFNTDDHQHRVQINGGKWITLPVKGDHMTRICDVQMDPTRAIQLEKMARTIEQSFMTKRFKYRQRLEEVVGNLRAWAAVLTETPTGKYPMVDLNNDLFMLMIKALGLDEDWSLNVDTVDRSTLGRIDKIRDCIEKWCDPEEQVSYLCGGGARIFMDFDSLGPDVTTYMQQMRPGFETGDSVLQLIAQHENPLEVIQQCAIWLDREGREYAWDMTPL